MDVRIKRGQTAPVNAPESLKDRYRGYVVDPGKVADRMVEAAIARVTSPPLRPHAKFSSR